jgi:phosphonate transport system permease protein
MLKGIGDFFVDLAHIFWPRSYKLKNGEEVKEKFHTAPYITIGLIALIWFCVSVTGTNFNTLIKRGDKFWELLSKMIPPNWDYFDTMKKPMLDTINMSLLGSVFGCAVALPVSFYLSNNFNLNRVYLVSHRILLSLLRTLPTLVLAAFFRMIVGTGALTGTIAISIFSYTICVKMMYEYIETIDMSPYEALLSTGASRPKAMRCAVWPQVSGYYLSTVLYCFESNVKSAAILGYVGAGGIGLILDSQLNLRKYANLGLVLLFMTATIVILEAIARYARRKLVKG